MKIVMSKGADGGRCLAFSVSKANGFLSKHGNNFAEKVVFPICRAEIVGANRSQDEASPRGLVSGEVERYVF